jgi:hypothetical protein
MPRICHARHLARALRHAMSASAKPPMTADEFIAEFIAWSSDQPKGIRHEITSSPRPIRASSFTIGAKRTAIS